VDLPLVYKRDDRRHRCGASLVDVVMGIAPRRTYASRQAPPNPAIGPSGPRRLRGVERFRAAAGAQTGARFDVLGDRPEPRVVGAGGCVLLIDAAESACRRRGHPNLRGARS
jgi:hypothetical protein